MFTRAEVRRGMEVVDRDGRRLGEVLWVRGGSAEPAPVATYPRSANEFDGERLGPMSTQAIGNRGPGVQRGTAGYAARSTDEAAPVERFLVGRWFGVAGRRWIDEGRIVNVSLERVVVDAG